MAGHHKLNPRGSGPLWFAMLAIVLFVLYSVTVALSTADRCGAYDKSWNVLPPRWECKTQPGFG
jgi:hypothetical protein